MQTDSSKHIEYASYSEHEDPYLNGNPLIESLAAPLERDQVFDRLRHDHLTAPNFSDLSKFYKKTQINHFSRVISPHPTSFFLYQKIMELILCGYITRNPFHAENVRLIATLAENARNGEYLQGVTNITELTTAPSCLASGLSGSSKTTTIREVLKLIKQVIHHREYKGKPFLRTQLTYISFDCAATRSPKALALSFFKAVDDVLHTKYFEEWARRSKDSVERYYANMQLIAAKHHIGFIHIDEVQFFLKYVNAKDSPNLTILESLFNKIGIPVLLSCTTEGLKLFQSIPSEHSTQIPDMTTTRRMVSDHEFVFSTYSFDSKEFDLIFDAFFPEKVCFGGKPGLEFKKTFHRLSVGLPAIINRLARLHHQQIVTLGNRRTDDVELLNDIYKSQFRHIDFALSHLRLSSKLAKPSVKQKNGFEQNLPKKQDGNVDWNGDGKLDKDKQEFVGQLPKLSEFGNSENSDASVNTDNDFDGGL
ncbi:hypothetical protein AX660_02105 [Paraglaciecola hydrolytica]|uniref:ORC1/DEAH AAA+ ATPase domain-containing protein n=2 Tax=Paraglaciecola hydrolytica TaxID=1799789 RepID=A0A148KL99_9ALTE|nr:hypothetical protein AX660_02105 [Paraglaciecola hydrolytica]